MGLWAGGSAHHKDTYVQLENNNRYPASNSPQRK